MTFPCASISAGREAGVSIEPVLLLILSLALLAGNMLLLVALRQRPSNRELPHQHEQESRWRLWQPVLAVVVIGALVAIAVALVTGADRLLGVATYVALGGFILFVVATGLTTLRR
jgi:fatty acid desaturase